MQHYTLTGKNQYSLIKRFYSDKLISPLKKKINYIVKCINIPKDIILMNNKNDHQTVTSVSLLLNIPSPGEELSAVFKYELWLQQI